MNECMWWRILNSLENQRMISYSEVWGVCRIPVYSIRQSTDSYTNILRYNALWCRNLWKGEESSLGKSCVGQAKVKLHQQPRRGKDPLNFKYKVSWKQVEKRCREGQRNNFIFLGSSPYYMRIADLLRQQLVFCIQLHQKPPYLICS